jgi:hypothetical protein
MDTLNIQTDIQGMVSRGCVAEPVGKKSAEQIEAPESKRKCCRKADAGNTLSQSQPDPEKSPGSMPRGVDSARCKKSMPVYIFRSFEEVNNRVPPLVKYDSKGVKWMLVQNYRFVKTVHILCKMRVSEPQSSAYLPAVLHSCVMLLSATTGRYREGTLESDLVDAEQDIFTWCTQWKQLKGGSTAIEKDMVDNEKLFRSLQFFSQSMLLAGIERSAPCSTHKTSLAILRWRASAYEKLKDPKRKSEEDLKAEAELARKKAFRKEMSAFYQG